MDGTHGSSAALSSQHGGSGVRGHGPWGGAGGGGEVGREDDRGTNKAYAESGMDRLGGRRGAIWSAHANERKKKSISNPWFVEINLKLSHLYLKLLISI
jgi:hypothetical protein